MLYILYIHMIFMVPFTIVISSSLSESVAGPW